MQQFDWVIGKAMGNEKYRMLIGTIKWRINHTHAWMWRRLLWRTTVIAVIGSCGKTTTKELIRSCIQEIGVTNASLGSWSGLRFGGIAAAILSTRFRDKYLVVEAGIEKPGEMQRIGGLLRPDVVVVTRIAPAHISYFDDLDHIALEKGALVEQCHRTGLVLLNRDDERVYAMKKRTKARVVTFGIHPEADMRCLEMSADWPSRLSLSIEYHDKSYEIQSKLVGNHWSESILAALATSHALGVPLTQCAERIGLVEPVWSRMQPIELPSGVTFIRDDYHGSPHNYRAAFEVMRTAPASRKIIITSAYSDLPGHSRDRMRALAEEAYDIFDIFVFFGESSKSAEKLLKGKGVKSEAVLATKDIFDIVRFLQQHLNRGDLVLLKGRTSAHISRAYLGLVGDLKCALPTCGHQFLCDRCPKLGFAWAEELKPYMAPPDCYL